MSKKVATSSPLSKYTPNVPVRAHILAKSGLTDQKIATALGVERQTFAKWLEKHPELTEALELARNSNSNPGQSETFQEYVYKQLSPDLQRLWDKIEHWADYENGVEKVEALLSGHTVRIRQSLWMHAMVHSNFNASEACRKVNISKKTLDNWVNDDPEFPKLVDELKWHRNNLFESTLIELVKSGNVLATMFANRTQNRDRGYSEKLSVQHSGTVQHLHNHVVSVDTLNLPLADRIKLRDALRDAKKVEQVANEDDAAPVVKPALALLEGDDDEER